MKSRDITQISKKKNFASRKNWKFENFGYIRLQKRKKNYWSLEWDLRFGIWNRMEWNLLWAASIVATEEFAEVEEIVKGKTGEVAKSSSISASFTVWVCLFSEPLEVTCLILPGLIVF